MYNKLETDFFSSFVLKSLSKKFSGKEKRELELRIKELLGTRRNILARNFYDVITLLSLDIDLICEKLFKEHKFTPIRAVGDSSNKLRLFLSIFLQDITRIASATGIENSRLTRLLSGEFKNLYPDEIYGLAKAFGLKPSQLFDYFYGDGKRPVVGM
ncbi:helix-turn-helix transcriptional regulator [Sphingobacterium sp. DN00404]|uniref:Helix-turn-helix transcriptional regulator n=1 Tax=Sphingobacterium micropteri TaxID=2763501 RepID=A0ABR7YKB6_9SPHI|nr:helix-turn-helix transcriptional regulator [Sphingobacterium micropteri]MBD1431768.1 helix-turn-helix transcriptional regulator [Sphingobacterium micropteri]